jgi:hypothetical protein
MIDYVPALCVVKYWKNFVLTQNRYLSLELASS